MDFEATNIIVCPICRGDARASVRCTHCRGSQVGLMDSEQGYLVWSESLDAFAFSFRRLRIRINAILHIFIACLVAGSVALFVIEVMRLANPGQLMQWEFWVAGYWYVDLLWLGALLGCFLIFRLAVFSERVRPMPGWGVHHSAKKAPAIDAKKKPELRA
ncbi:MAG TPA: hypothetical protein VFQ60_02780, partial [Patescibacteria group bacterium]|nr:hypothetical protein [Patescibacteria group bacterium]